jgi:small subunit ribosomal protein S30e
LVVPAAGASSGKQKNKSPNWHAGRKELVEEEKKKQKQQREQFKSKK